MHPRFSRDIPENQKSGCQEKRNPKGSGGEYFFGKDLMERSRKILVVDDDETIRNLCEEVLTVAGYSVVSAARGLDGLERLKRGAFDLVISDIYMPGLGGAEFYSRTVAEYPHLRDRFLFITGDTDPGALKKVANGRDLRLLLKPFRIAELIGCVDDAMESALEGADAEPEASKRRDARFGLEADCQVFEEGAAGRRFFAAATENISRTGAKIVHEAGPLMPGSEVSVYISINSLSLHRFAKVVWAKVSGAKRSVAGLRFDSPMPVSSIINMLPARTV